MTYDLSAIERIIIIPEKKHRIDSLSEFLTKTVQFHNKSLIIYCLIVLISNLYFVNHFIIILNYSIVLWAVFQYLTLIVST